MAGGKVSLLQTHVCLISEISRKLLEKNTKNLGSYLVLLPTARLGTLLLASLARRLVGFIPPKVMTLQGWMRQYGNSNDASNRRVVSDDQQVIAMGHLLLSGERRHLRLGHERELVLLFHEIDEMASDECVFAKLKEVLEEDIYRHDVPLGALHERAVEMAELYQEWRHYWHHRGLCTKGLYDRDLANRMESELAAGDEPSWLAPFQEVWLGGFTSVAPAWYPLMGALSRHDKVKMWLPAPPRHSGEDSPLAQLIKACSQDEDKSMPLPTVTTVEREGYPPVVVTTDHPMAEAAYALHQASSWQADGIPASQIGIIVSHEGTYESCIRTLLAHRQQEANCALAKPFSQTAVGGFFSALSDLNGSDHGAGKVLEFLMHPLVRTKWEEHQEAPPLLEFLTPLVGGVAEVTAYIAGAPEMAQALKDLLTGLRPLMVKDSHTPHQWLNLMEGYYQDYVVGAIAWDAEGLAASTKDAVVGFFRQAYQCAATMDYEIDFGVFWQLFGARLLAGEVRATGEPLAGIQILSLAESRYVPLAAAVLLGCNEGTFPKALPKDELLDDYLKRRMELKGWRQLEMMEDLTFHLLKERLPRLVLSRCQFVGDNYQIRSRFVEKLMAKDNVECFHYPFDPETFFGLSRGDETELQWEGIPYKKPEEWVEQVSASGLERLLRCPYRYYVGRHGLRPMELPTPFADKRHEGEWLHQVLEVFCQELESLDLTDGLARVGLQRLMQLTVRLGPDGIQHEPLYQQLRLRSWPRFLEHLANLYGPDLKEKVGSWGTEVEVRPSEGASVRGAERRFFGIIDHVGATHEMVVITDYKRRRPPNGADVKKGVSPQLTVYSRAYAQLEPGVGDKLVLGYWNIMDGEWTAGAVAPGVKAAAMAKGLAKKTTPDLFDLWELYEAVWTWREDKITARQAYYADPSRCDFCDNQGYCRKDEPQAKDRIESQADLNQEWLKGDQV